MNANRVIKGADLQLPHQPSELHGQNAAGQNDLPAELQRPPPPVSEVE
jgi:hypothetical protein